MATKSLTTPPNVFLLICIFSFIYFVFLVDFTYFLCEVRSGQRQQKDLPLFHMSFLFIHICFFLIHFVFLVFCLFFSCEVRSGQRQQKTHHSSSTSHFYSFVFIFRYFLFLFIYFTLFCSFFPCEVRSGQRQQKGWGNKAQWRCLSLCVSPATAAWTHYQQPCVSLTHVNNGFAVKKRNYKSC